ncbi:MAG: YciI family protein [Ilumatobacter sp.]|uniref:YciI family protein n=1 Tax=Ilumatobacter sp. TaxID=1967498 RepID=UPI002634E904|nr:YciI family protein [Ilumatobacter sp.]MDJ0770924.1 YciI family protein [Ilumatobacter sp.]
MLLIYSDPSVELSEAETNEMMTDYFAFTQRIVESGEMVSGEPLQEKETASTVRIREGATAVTDGPFAETKEVLGGFYMVDVDSVERAQELAAQIPTAKWGSIEVRPLMEIPEEQRADDPA